MKLPNTCSLMQMERNPIFTWCVILISVSVAPSYGTYYSRPRPYTSPPEQVTFLHFYFPNTLSPPNATAVLVADANYTGGPAGPLGFGRLFAADDPLSLGPDYATSEVIGSCQGMYVSSGRTALSLVVYYDFRFTSGRFNGSSISAFSRNPPLLNQRDIAVVGGTGRLRMAKGFIRFTTYSANTTTGDAVVECNATVIHY